MVSPHISRFQPPLLGLYGALQRLIKIDQQVPIDLLHIPGLEPGRQLDYSVVPDLVVRLHYGGTRYDFSVVAHIPSDPLAVGYRIEVIGLQYCNQIYLIDDRWLFPLQLEVEARISEPGDYTRIATFQKIPD